MINITNDQMKSLNKITDTLKIRPETIELKFNSDNGIIIAKYNFKEVTGFAYLIDKECNMIVCDTEMYYKNNNTEIKNKLDFK